MKKLFYLGLTCLLLFEIANVYFIMPMPGSQQMNSVDTAYFLYRYRWVFRIILLAFMLIGLFKANWKRKWTVAIPVLIAGAIIYMANFVMAADHMFYHPQNVLMVKESANKVDTNRLIIGIEYKGETRAYPIRFLGYHHQVQDSIAGKPVLITYCTVCRTGRVYEPFVGVKAEQFRLVGMDHFNAMFEDATTKSWWRQVTGEAIAGKLKGQYLPEFFSVQTSLAQWLKLNPGSLIMQADPAFVSKYDTTLKYENGKSTSSLTGTDSLSWKEKSWVVGIHAGATKKAYDWNRLKAQKIINDTAGNHFIILVLAKDNKSFFAFEGPAGSKAFYLQNDTIISGNHHYSIDGKGIDTSFALKPLPAYQEFWHSWRTFNPGTQLYKD